ncbi:hypothetical protein BHF71_01500 [Vulcanibacillus modesticaldus]|uniref:DUF2520 domain-containing protein n=1 Tax=Vulcanibacillus modesticaldus TaxID=337097 RepID=A0A1D2YW66_9BACI|nr:Rossmann-like and DUF2520 domain-containing protein [Vulcanibacillus modesticaldus]OEF99875.1 hypothetical protein BHF71_01500 [Vulcanibacillus modesticaldus]
MKIGFIGAGKVGTAMGIYLQNKVEVTGYYSRSYSSASKAARYTESKGYKNLESLVHEADMIAITTPDDIIKRVADDLLNITMSWEGKIVLHMSGAHSSDVLSLLAEKGATILSLHPMLSFSEPFKAARDLSFASFTIEGRGNLLEKVKHLLDGIGNHWIEIPTQDKVLYHTAAVIVSNYLVTLIDTGVQMLISTGFTKEDATKLLTPLIKKTMETILEKGAEKALTGPISRGDLGTLKMHLNNLENRNKSWLDSYKVLGVQTIDLALRAKRINDESANQMKGVLSQDDQKSNNGNIQEDETR